MPLILGTNSIKDTGYNVANSLRFDIGSTDNLTKTFSTPTNAKKFTFSTWTKKAKNGTFQTLFSAYHSTIYAQNPFGFSEHTYDDIFFNQFNGSSYDFRLATTQLHRDQSAWYHIVLSVDTTQATASNRIKIYVNGVQVTAFDTEIYPSQNFEMKMNSAVNHAIGVTLYNPSNLTYLSCYMAETVFIDGQQLTPTSFGEFDEDSPTIWKPKDVSGLTFGTNGFYLDFENSGSLGADVSGNGNNFTVNNLTSIDQSTDTCTNNFATANPLIYKTNIDYADGNLNSYHTFTNEYRTTQATFGTDSGKWYAEWKVSAIGQEVAVGVMLPENLPQNSGNHYVGKFTGDVGYFNSGNIIKNGSVSQGTGTTFTTNDIISVAMDLDGNTVQFYKNGSTVGSTESLTSGATYIFAVSGMGDARVLWNFGNPPFSISSGNSDANGFGNFEYSVPSGYFSLCTKNLAEYG
jgi:hypothetical protein